MKYKMSELVKLLKPPTIRFVDHIVYLILCFLTIFLVIPYSLIYKKLILKSIAPIFVRLMFKDLIIQHKGAKFIARKNKSDIIVLSELYEPWMEKYFKPKEGDIVIDVGAHVGKYTLYAAKLVGSNGKVIAIEANPDNYEQLLKNIKLNNFNNILSYNYVITNEDFVKCKCINPNSKDDAVFSFTKDDEGNIIGRTIDSILYENKIQKVDWVKIDVEGKEVEVLQGMTETIKNSKNLKILIEVWDTNEKKVREILQNFHEIIVNEYPEYGYKVKLYIKSDNYVQS